MGRIGDHRASQINWARAAFNLFCESLEMTPGGSANWLLCFHDGSGRIKVLLETTDFLFWDVAMSQELNTVAFGLAASLSWGIGDFSGGLATRRASVFSVVVAAHATGLVLLVVLALACSEPFPSALQFLWGVRTVVTADVGHLHG